ncbi:hypothetical protein N9230_00880 [Akkermansiaceae bacterium]|nr:hypothetical protein [Akkermansiaceae bacterium]
MGFAQATTALIDFGRADAAAPSTYNSAPILGANASDVTTGAVDLSDTSSTATGWTVTVTETGSGSGGNAGAGADVTSFPPDLASYETAALANSIFANQGGASDPAMILLFSGLSPTGSYDLILYGSRANAQGADQRWSLTQGSGGADVDQNSELNDTVYVDWEGVTPNASGEIEITINSPGPDMIGALALNFASITETTDVELITSFTTDSETASPGDPATLSWEIVEPLDALELDDGNGNLTDLLPLTTAGTGSTTVSPSETTLYSITATSGEKNQTRRIQIFSGEAPTISSFTASESLIQEGSSIDLTWTVSGDTSLTLDPGATDITGTTTINLSPVETTTYTLTATNTFGSSTAEVTVDVETGPVPTHRNIASFSGNSDGIWLDQVGNRNWTMTGAILNSPLATPSANTNIAAAYSTTGGTTGGSTTSFQYPEITIEVWFRPGNLTADHQVIFETGGGQNGLSAIITDTAIRLIGSALDIRNLDTTIPTAGLNLDDFLQLVITNNAGTDDYRATLRDTFGNVRTVSETADIVVGVNGGGLFVWASGVLGGASSLLGGSTDDPAAAPTGLTGFEGEIAILNIYDRILDEAESQATFDRVATTTSGPAGLIVTEVSFDDPADELTITWNSINGQSYSVEFSTSLKGDEWFELDGPFTANSDSTTEILSLPPNQDRFFVRVVVDTP